MGRKSREKGNVWMREVAGHLRRLFTMDIHKGDQGRKGSDVADVDSPDCPVWVECKHAATVSYANPYKALAQAAEDAKGRRPVVAFCRVSSKTAGADRYPPLMAVPLEFGLELLSIWHAGRHTPVGVQMRGLARRILAGAVPDPFPSPGTPAARARKAAAPPEGTPPAKTCACRGTLKGQDVQHTPTHCAEVRHAATQVAEDADD